MSRSAMERRVARWFIFKPKFPNWGNFGGPKVEKIDILYNHLEDFTDIYDILILFGTFCVHLVFFSIFVSCTNKNLATLMERSF
jgi:hypothetical protein